MTDNATDRFEAAAAKEPLDLRQTVELLIRARPDLADPARLRVFQEALGEHLARCDAPDDRAPRQITAEAQQAEMNRAKRLTAFATTASGGVSAGAIAVATAPNAPVLVILAIVLLGLVGTAFAAPWLDRLGDRAQQEHRRAPV